MRMQSVEISYPNNPSFEWVGIRRTEEERSAQVSGFFHGVTAMTAIAATIPNNANYGAKTASLFTGITTPPTGPAESTSALIMRLAAISNWYR